MDSAFRGENGLGCWRPFLWVRFLLGEQKKMKTGLRTLKSRVYCSFQGLHYPRHLKNNAEFAKIKRSPIISNINPIAGCTGPGTPGGLYLLLPLNTLVHSSFRKKTFPYLDSNSNAPAEFPVSDRTTVHLWLLEKSVRLLFKS